MQAIAELGLIVVQMDGMGNLKSFEGLSRRKRWDFFVHHLLGKESPDRNATSATLAGAPRH